MKSKEELKKYFENGDKPTQEQFWEWQESYWHKDEKLENTIPLSGTEEDKPVIGNIVILPSTRNDISIGSEKGKITFNTGGFINLRSEDNGTVGQMMIASSAAYLQYYPAVGSEKSIVLNDEGITMRGLQQAGEGNHKQLVIDPITSTLAFRDLGSIYKVKGSVANMDTLNTFTGMVEGDVYNVISTGENYVYVNDVEATGNAGWDKLSGIHDLSSYATQLYVDEKLGADEGGVWNFPV